MYSKHHDNHRLVLTSRAAEARSSNLFAPSLSIWKIAAAAALILPTVLTSHAQLYRLSSASAFAPSAGLVDFETPLLVNPTYNVSTGLGNVGVSTGSGFVGESISSVAGIPTLFSHSAGLPTLNPAGPPGPDSHDVWTYKETVQHDPEVRGPGVLMSDFQSDGAVSILFSTPVAAVGLDLANYQFPAEGNDHVGAYQIFAYGSDGSLLGTFGDLRDNTVYSDVSTYEFVGFATTSGMPLIRALTVGSMSGSAPVSDGPFVDNRIDNLRFGAVTDLVGAPVPEPSTYALGATVLLGALTVLRRRKRDL